jgi:hypothetical protein
MTRKERLELSEIRKDMRKFKQLLLEFKDMYDDYCKTK